MQITDALRWWDFRPQLRSEADKVVCPDCKVASPFSEWREGEVYCELCSTHDAMICPECEELFDHVFGPEFKVIPDGTTPEQ